MTDTETRPADAAVSLPSASPRPKPSPRPTLDRAPQPQPSVESPPGDGAPIRQAFARLGAVGLVLGAVIVLLVATVIVLLVRASDDSDTIARQDGLADARSSVLAAAKRYAIDFTTYDYKNLDAGFERTEAELTGKFKRQYTATTKALKETIIKYKATATSKVQAIAVQSVTTSDAVVIAFVDQTITNTTSNTPQLERNRMQITLHREGSGPWLITDLQLP